jgi:hypothetical protein
MLIILTGFILVLRCVNVIILAHYHASIFLRRFKSNSKRRSGWADADYIALSYVAFKYIDA